MLKYKIYKVHLLTLKWSFLLILRKDSKKKDPQFIESLCKKASASLLKFFYNKFTSSIHLMFCFCTLNTIRAAIY